MQDSGLTAHLLGIGRERLATEPHLAGGLLEVFVAMELRNKSAGTGFGLAHFRTRSGDEVDLVMEARDGTVVGVEVKS